MLKLTIFEWKLARDVESSGSPTFLKKRLGCEMGSIRFFFLSPAYHSISLKSRYRAD